MTELKRSLGLTSAVMITVGSVIGSGIFLKPWEIARYLPDLGSVLICWTGIGLACLFGSFAYAELGTMFPEAGGQYAFLREGWGRLVAFLYGWCLLLVINTGSLAALAVAFSASLATLLPLGTWSEIALSMLMILSLAIPNHFGVRWGAVLQNVSTVAKLLALGGIVAAGIWAGGGEVSPAAGVSPAGTDLVAGIVAACVAIFWAYEGWYQLTFNAAECRRPERDVPWGLILGLAVLVITYLAVNAIYISYVPLEEMRTLEREVDVPRLTMERIFGPGAGTWVALLICLSVYGAGNPNLLSAPRAYYAMAADGLVMRSLTRVHPVYRTPTLAIWLQAGWAMVLILVLKTFKDITEYVVFASLIFYGLTVAAVYVLRHRRPDHPRAFRCYGYPVTPALFIALVVFVDLYTLSDASRRMNALLGLVILAAGLPVYLYMGRGRSGGGS